MLRWPVGPCFSGARVRNQIRPFQGVRRKEEWRGGDERRGEEAEDEELPLSRCHYLNLIQG